jgi:hypothetical protein
MLAAAAHASFCLAPLRRPREPWPPPASRHSITNLLRYIEWDAGAFIRETKRPDLDGVIATFQSTHPRFSYVLTDPATGLVQQAAEKRTISDQATCGVYFWRRGSDFCRYARDTFAREMKTNGQYYISNAYELAIQAGLRIGPFECRRMWPFNTPKDLEQYYLAKKNGLIQS